MAAALGVKFYNREGVQLPAGGKYLLDIEGIDILNMAGELAGIEFIVASDVTNPLCGPEGASRVFGPQKGATPEQVEMLDRGMEHYAGVLEKLIGKSVKDIPGSGAAGGLGAGLMAFLDTSMKPGFEVVKERTGIADIIPSVDLVITGEGRIDAQTQYGKTPFGVAQLARQYHIPVMAFAGSIGENTDSLYEKGFDCIIPIVENPVTQEYSIREAAKLLQKAAERAMREFYVAGKAQPK